MNSVVLLGRVTRDLELRHTQSGKAVTNLSIAVNEGYGEKRKAYFFRVIVWDKQAESCHKYLSKGSLIAVKGTLIQTSWVDKSGEKKSQVEVRADNVEFLSKKEESPEEMTLNLSDE